MSYFSAVRLFSIVELCLFASLLAVAIGGYGEHAELLLGWSHGVGWILLCCLVGWGSTRGVFTWVVFAATVSPAGPLGSTLGIEWMARRMRRQPAAGS